MKARKIRLIVTSVIGGAIILILVAATAFILISHARGQIPFFGQKSIMWITTGSMEPTIPERSYILFEKADAKDVAIGDVIVFISDDPEIEGQYNTHRVVGVNGDNESFVTRGDNVNTNKVNDAYPARAERLVGRFLRVLPFLSVMGRFLSSTVGIFAMVVLILAVLMLMYLPDMARVMKAAEKAKKEKSALMEDLIKKEVERLRAENARSAEREDKEDKEDTKEDKEEKEEKEEKTHEPAGKGLREDTLPPHRAGTPGARRVKRVSSGKTGAAKAAREKSGEKRLKKTVRRRRDR